MEHIIQFPLIQLYFEYGYADGKNGIYDTSYLNRSSDGTLSYTAGFNKAKEEESAKLSYNRTFQYSII